ncbi:MAG: hypothetical protein C4583_09485 [Anaerolineaceae bacterium]|nr:MAG: hypothetical protein C4583_09485 [Anaerolineaceae bacterium]
MKKNNVFVVASTSLILLLVACNVIKPTPAPTQTPAVPPATGVQYHFVTNKLLIPTTQAQTQDFALNIDEDSQQKPDNKFGELLTLLTSAAPNLNLQSTLDQEVSSGHLVSLHVVKADDPLNDSSVSWSIFLGQKAQSAPRFDGADNFTVDSAVPANSPIIGSLTNGHFTGGQGAARIQMFLLGQPIEVNLIGVRLEADTSAKGCSNGKLGGGVTVDDFRDNLLPAIASGLNQIITNNQDAANALLPIFDADHDGVIVTQELENNPLLMIAVSPDLDLLDASGKFSPGQDGVTDSYSVGLGFTCVPASFIASGD